LLGNTSQEASRPFVLPIRDAKRPLLRSHAKRGNERKSSYYKYIAPNGAFHLVSSGYEALPRNPNDDGSAVRQSEAEPDFEIFNIQNDEYLAVTHGEAEPRNEESPSSSAFLRKAWEREQIKRRVAFYPSA